MKTSAKHFGNMSQNDPKTTSLMMSVTKNPQLPTKKIFLSAFY